jgi:polysaccharide export outer membrane protein
MKQIRQTISAVAVCLTVLMTGLLAGCGTGGPVYQEYQGMSGAFRAPTDLFHVGDTVVITFSSPAAAQQMSPHEEKVKEDGYITPPDIGRIKAVGRTAGELQKEVQEKYDKLYRNLTVTVKPGDRFYSVDGEVRNSGPKPYLGKTDVVDAIAAAGGFTDFAKKSKVQLIHPNGKKEIINYQKAIEDSTYNRAVYPGDQVIVPRRFF